MAKLTAWLVTLIGVLLILPAIGVTQIATVSNEWIIPLAVIVIGIGKLVRNYSAKKRK